MSGGVDSSVAAALLKKGLFLPAGRRVDVVAAHMICWKDAVGSAKADRCAAERDAEDARRVANKLDIPFYVFDFEKEYREKVFDYMVREYRNGRTPNPDVMCNKEIKFGIFLEKALEMGADYIASGHYVRLRKSETQNSKFETSPKPKFQNSKLSTSHFSLFIAKDLNKDQSYFLWTLTQDQLKHCLFPIGDYVKSEVRKMAREFGLPTAEKKDSQGICFLGKVTLDKFLSQYIPEKRGLVLTAAGEKIGEHKGAHFYTIGQRHISIANRQSPIVNREENFKPCYVAEKDIKTNTLVVVEDDENPALYRKEIELTDVNFITSFLPFLIRASKGMEVLARIRYRQPLVKATLIFTDDIKISADIKNKNPRKSALKSASIRVLFEKPQKAVAPGQSAVFYDEKGGMLGGGVIC